jgi:hypothetical protein
MSTKACCPICNQDFTWRFGDRPRKQCNKCSRAVCAQCCSQRFLLPHVDPTKPKRVCDICAKGGSAQTVDPFTLRLYTGTAQVQGRRASASDGESLDDFSE